jgi:hypothetical protein
LKVLPPSANTATGQVVSFKTAAPWPGGVKWSVLPATAGTIDGNGNFRPAGTPGIAKVVATWAFNESYSASALVFIQGPPPPAEASPTIVQASGGNQASADGSIRNVAVLGETVVSQQASDPSDRVVVRHGYDLEVAAESP